jgi:hypothetical protein
MVPDGRSKRAWMRAAAFGLACGIAGAALALIAPSLVPYNEGAPQSAGQSPKAKVKPPSPDDRIADYTLWLERFTGALAFVSSIQIFFLVRADRTASRTVAKMDDTARKQLRAYVNVSSALVRYDRRKPDGCSIEVRVQNYGQTPALDVISVWGEHVREWPLRSELPAPPPIPVGVGPLPPGRESIQWIPIGALSPREEEELKAGRAGVYFWGVTTYKDIYGDPHVTNIKFVCEGEGLRAGLMHECGEEGNEAT